MKIAVLGATSSVGTPTIFNLAFSGLADELLIVGGSRQNVLQHYALDLRTAVATEDIAILSGTYDDLAGSDIIINVAGAHLPADLEMKQKLKQQLELVKEIALKIKQYCPQAVVITGINPVDALNYVMFLAGGFDRRQLIGYSINDTFRFRQLVAAELKVKTRMVEGLVIGEHGKTQVPLFSSVKVEGKPVSIPQAAQQRILSKIPEAIKRFEALKANRTAGFTCAIGLTQITRAIVEDSGTVIPCSAVLDGEYGQHNLSMCVPTVLGKGGIKKILEYDLTTEEQKNVEITVNTLKTTAELVESELRDIK